MCFSVLTQRIGGSVRCSAFLASVGAVFDVLGIGGSVALITGSIRHGTSRDEISEEPRTSRLVISGL